MVSHDKNYVPEQYTLKKLEWNQSIPAQYSHMNGSKRCFTAKVKSSTGIFFVETAWSGRQDNLVGIYFITSPYINFRGLAWGKKTRSFAETQAGVAETLYTGSVSSIISWDVTNNTITILEDNGILNSALVSGFSFTFYK